MAFRRLQSAGAQENINAIFSKYGFNLKEILRVYFFLTLERRTSKSNVNDTPRSG